MILNSVSMKTSFTIGLPFSSVLLHLMILSPLLMFLSSVHYIQLLYSKFQPIKTFILSSYWTFIVTPYFVWNNVKTQVTILSYILPFVVGENFRRPFRYLNSLSTQSLCRSPVSIVSLTSVSSCISHNDYCHSKFLYYGLPLYLDSRNTRFSLLVYIRLSLIFTETFSRSLNSASETPRVKIKDLV